ncbi:MAG: S1/P1 nuclease [Bacteriovoracaceae bacterium]
MKKLSILFLAAMSLNSYGWGDLGHATIGYLAEKNLSPEGKKFIYNVLGGEPLALSSTYPDNVRDDERYLGFANYHFFEIRPGQTYETIPKEDLAKKSADTIISQVPSALVSKRGVNIFQKQIILRYLIHVIGDVHQPLHVGNGLDRGANLCDIISGENRLNLHSFWDTNLLDTFRPIILNQASQNQKPIKYYSYKNFGDYLWQQAEKDGSLIELQKKVEGTSKSDWYKEAQQLHSEVYPDERPVNHPSERGYCKLVNLKTGSIEMGNYSVDKIPKISPDYIKNSQSLVKKQILLGALRVKQVIEQMAKEINVRPMTAEQEIAFFNKIMFETDTGMKGHDHH